MRAARLDPRLMLAPPPLTEGVMVLPSLLAEGAAAVIAQAVRGLPMGAVWEPDTGLFWRCEAHVPPVLDPQLPEGFFWASRLMDIELPRLLARMGLRVRATRPGVIDAIALRKGSWLRMQPSEWVALIGLTGSPWPQEWGGQLSAGLTLIPPGAVVEVGVLTKHVESLALRCRLEEM
ncbi:MAG: hypothetical protein P8R54_09625 [Myxococcota bacterium]|nr:hypothetical protein [Myxococcota bacterium]